MSRPAAARRTALSGLSGAVLAAAVAVVPAGPMVQAVVSYDGRLAPTAGVRVLTTMPSLQTAVVRGDALAMSRLALAPNVRGVTPDSEVELTAAQDDGAAEAVLASTGLGGAAGAPGAGAGVRVAVVDTGVSDTAALNRASGRLVDAADTSSGELRTGGRYTDGYGHGTFMAGVVAGGVAPSSGGEAIGVAPGATVLVVRVARPDGSTSLSRVLAGLEWVAAHAEQVDVVNLSLSYDRPGHGYGPDPLTAAVERVRDAGTTVVVSAGNDKNRLSDPGFDPRVLTVGAYDTAEERVATFSGSGVVAGVVKPDVVATGVHVMGLLPEGSALARVNRSHRLDNGMYRGSGTSQSAAVTSGVAALLLAAHPGATPAQVKASIRCAATDMRGPRDGQGLVHATTQLCAGEDGAALDGSGDLTGEATFNASAWAASAWAASAWAASAWAASAWAASAWAASAWAASAWAASAWGSGGRS